MEDDPTGKAKGISILTRVRNYRLMGVVSFAILFMILHITVSRESSFIIPSPQDYNIFRMEMNNSNTFFQSATFQTHAFANLQGKTTNTISSHLIAASFKSSESELKDTSNSLEDLKKRCESSLPGGGDTFRCAIFKPEGYESDVIGNVYYYLLSHALGTSLHVPVTNLQNHTFQRNLIIL